GAPVEQTVEDIPNLWLEVVQANAVADSGQPARVRVHRDGDLAQGITINLNLGGTAKQGVHIGEMPDSVTIAAGEASTDLQINARAEGLTDSAKIAVLSLQTRAEYQLGNPHEAVVYVAMSNDVAQGIGFDRWLQTSTDGAITNLADLIRIAPETARDYLRAYAFGLASVDELKTHHIDLRLVDGRPELTAAGSFEAADVRWGVQASGDLGDWSDTSNTFVEVANADGLKLVGEPLAPDEQQKFYRINLSLDPGQLAGTQIVALTGATKFGISGDATWSTDQATGGLQSSGGTPGAINRIIAEVAADAVVDFTMELLAGGGDSLIFYIDGVMVAETEDESVSVQEQLSGSEAHLLMWEFRSGQALIAPSAQ
ncbi:MAG: hypothetical protein ACI9UA_004282, partial [Pseudoalteromonas tetraodonis]